MEKTKLRLLAASLAALAAIAGLAAYFTNSDTVTNVFPSSALRIQVIEPHWIDSQTIVPNQQVDKDPYIVNTDETPAYVFMKVTVPTRKVTVEKREEDAQKGTHFVTENVPLFHFLTQNSSYTEAELLTSLQHHNNGWYLMPGYPNELTEKTDTLTYLYAWTGGNQDSTMAVLAPDQRTDFPLFDQVLFCNAREDEQLPGSIQKIRIEVYGIQTEYLKSPTETETTAEEVWKLLTSSS